MNSEQISCFDTLMNVSFQRLEKPTFSHFRSRFSFFLVRQYWIDFIANGKEKESKTWDWFITSHSQKQQIKKHLTSIGSKCFKMWTTKKCHHRHDQGISLAVQVARDVHQRRHQCLNDNKWHCLCKWLRLAIKEVTTSDKMRFDWIVCWLLVFAELSPNSAGSASGTSSGGGNGGIARSRDRNERGETAMHVAAIKGDQDGVKKLLEQGMSPNVADFAGNWLQ